MPDLENLKDEILIYFETRFGVARELLAPLCFQAYHDEIWAASACLPDGISARRPTGLRILRRIQSDLKPTSSFLQLLGERITTSRVDLPDIGTLKQLLLGVAIVTCAPDGFVAISFCGDVLGCGVVKEERLRALIPTGRRKELLDILLVEAQP